MEESYVLFCTYFFFVFSLKFNDFPPLFTINMTFKKNMFFFIFDDFYSNT